MKAKAMNQLGHAGNHLAAPQKWRDVPNVTGDYDLDATILHRDNTDLPHRLKLYTKQRSYGIRTGYSGYHNYAGDD